MLQETDVSPWKLSNHKAPWRSCLLNSRYKRWRKVCGSVTEHLPSTPRALGSSITLGVKKKNCWHNLQRTGTRKSAGGGCGSRMSWWLQELSFKTTLLDYRTPLESAASLCDSDSRAGKLITQCPISLGFRTFHAQGHGHHELWH